MLEAPVRCVRIAVLALVSGAALAIPCGPAAGAPAEAPRIVRNPGGGELIYARFPGASEKVAMQEMLRAVAGRLGDRPRLGTLVRDAQERVLIGTFEATAKKGDGKPRVGMLLAAPFPGGYQSAALVDEPGRFPRTQPQMLATLLGTGGPGVSPPPVAPAAPLAQVALPDGSGQVGIAAGWRISYGQMGTAVLDGPRGEKVMINLSYQMIAPGSPYARYNPGHAPVPWGTGLVKAWSVALPIRCRAMGIPVLSVSVVRTAPIPAAAGWAALHVEGLMDRHDGLGRRDFQARLHGVDVGSGIWTLYETSIQLPQAVSARTVQTGIAIVNSFRMNARMIRDVYQTRIQGQWAAFNAQQEVHRAQVAAGEAQVAGYWARQDANARSSKGFQNYLLDRTVVEDGQGGRATLANSAAATLIRSDPGRFREVPTSEYARDIDY